MAQPTAYYGDCAGVLVGDGQRVIVGEGVIGVAKGWRVNVGDGVKVKNGVLVGEGVTLFTSG